MSNDLVVKANKVVEASYFLSTLEQRLILSAMAKIPKEVPVGDGEIYYVSTEDFIELGSNKNNAWRDLAEATSKLWSREIKFFDKDTGSHVHTRWLQQKAVKEGNSVGVMFSTPLKPYLTNLTTQFTQYLKKDIAGVKSAYTIRFYELICQYRKTGKREIGVEDLRAILAVGEKYSLFADLKKRVIIPAIKEINLKTPMRVTCEDVKEGKKTVGVKLCFKEVSSVKKTKLANIDKAIEDAKSGNPSWMKKGLNENQIKKIGVHRNDFIDMNNSVEKLIAGGASSRDDYPVIWESWKPLLADPNKVGMFKGIEEVLKRPRFQ